LSFIESGLVHYEEKGTVKNSYLLLPSVTRADDGKYRCGTMLRIRIHHMQIRIQTFKGMRIRIQPLKLAL
jgi:hypothetical protein